MKIFLFFLVSMTIVSGYAQQGSTDKSFGKGGMILDTTIWANCNAMAIQPDGKILTGGYTEDVEHPLNLGGFYIARYNNDGSIDDTFGENGKIIIRKIQNVLAFSPKTIIVQHDNKILALARVVPGKLYGDIGLIRLNEDGSMDNSFGTNGFVLTSVSKWEDVLGGMVVQPDGKIVVSGNRQDDESQPGPDFVLRYLPDGSFDESFGEKGQVLTYFTSNVDPGSVILQPDGKIVTSDRYGVSTSQFQLIRYNIDGMLDKTFGAEGIARLKPASGFLNQPNSLAIENEGKIIVAGTYDAFEPAMALARFNADGSIDSAFGNLGLGYTYFYTPNVSAIAKSVFVTANKKIVLTGNYYKSAAEQVAAVQYNSNGIIDSSFGENGVAAGGFAENKYGSDISSGVGLLQPDGKIIVSGSFLQNDGDTYNVALFRFNGDLNKKQILIAKIRRWLQHHNGITWDYNKNISSYVVQRSYDGTHFSSITRITASNNSNYTYADPSPLSGNNYYRLQTTSLNGVVANSNVIAITANEDAIKISPNPAKSSLHIEGLSPNKTKLTILDFTGNVKLQAVANNASYNLNIASLTTGNYLLKIEINGETITKKFLKE